MGHRETVDIEVWGGQVRTQVLVGGDGPPLLYLHAVLGLTWDPFLDSLAELDEAHERALALGARVVLDRRDDPEEALYVYLDPAGHPFCLFTQSS